ncbi:hypothetical protein ACHAWF_007975 [Thalassiosira exigua]
MGRRKKKGNGGSRGRSPSSPPSDTPSFDIDVDAPLPLDVGTRVELPDLTALGIPSGGRPHVGTVVAHWQRKAHWPESVRAPYLVTLDDGTTIFCPRTDEAFVRRSDVPPLEVEFYIGSRVECQLSDGKWFPGTVLQCDEEWASPSRATTTMGGKFFVNYPYLIKFDYGRERPFWGPADCIRKSLVLPSARKMCDDCLRFMVGDRVECMGEDDWSTGVIVDTWYREEEFAPGHFVPYQIRLDDGHLIFAPTDTDDCIRESSAPPLPLRFQAGDRVECSVEEGWVKGTVIQTHYDGEGFEDGRVAPYQVLLDNKQFVYAPLDTDDSVRKPLRFVPGDRVDSKVEGVWIPGTVYKTRCDDDEGEEVMYDVQLDTGDGLFVGIDGDDFIRTSTLGHVCRGEHNGFVRAMVSLLLHNGDFDEATGVLRERIEVLRSKIETCSSQRYADCYRVDLTSYLWYMSEVQQATGRLDEMKETLDEALALNDTLKDGARSQRQLNLSEKLALHSSLVGDDRSALRHFEEAVALAKSLSDVDSFRLGFALFKCGKLNVRCGNGAMGLEQVAEGVDMLSRVCGDDDERVQKARQQLETLRVMKHQDIV